jgi:hypothetical protein
MVAVASNNDEVVDYLAEFYKVPGHVPLSPASRAAVLTDWIKGAVDEGVQT